MADLTDTDAVVESIKAGDHDGHLVSIIEAVRRRFEFGERDQKWVIAYDVDGEEHVAREVDLTLGECRLVERIVVTDWGQLNPVNSGSECLAIIAACLHTRHGKALKLTRDGPSGEAWDLASAIPVDQAVAAITSEEVERAPKP